MIAKGKKHWIQGMLKRHNQLPALTWRFYDTSKPDPTIEMLLVNVGRHFLRPDVHLRIFDLALL